MTAAVPNPRLRRHVTQASFQLTLSARMIRALLRLDGWERHVKQHPWMDNEANFAGTSLERCLDPQQARALEARGMVNRTERTARQRDDYTAEFELTRAGRLAAQLLREAGFDLEFRYPSRPHPDDRPKIAMGLGRDDAMVLDPDGDRRHEEPRGLG